MEIWERLCRRMQSILYEYQMKSLLWPLLNQPISTPFAFHIGLSLQCRSGSSTETPRKMSNKPLATNIIYLLWLQYYTCAMCVTRVCDRILFSCVSSVSFFLSEKYVYLYLERECNLIRHSNALSSFILKKYFVVHRMVSRSGSRHTFSRETLSLSYRRIIKPPFTSNFIINHKKKCVASVSVIWRPFSIFVR